MACFPQLLTGATSQYPIRKRTAYRTIRNLCLDGREIKLADPAASTIGWTLTFQELVDDEIAALRDFCEHGRWSAHVYIPRSYR